MHRSSRWLAIASSVAVAVAVPGRAFAEAQCELRGSLGWAAGDRIAAGASYAVPLGLAILLRTGALLAGPVVTASMGQGAVRVDSLYLGGVVGYTRLVAAGWRLELLAEGGAHDVDSVWESRYTEGDVQFGLPSWFISQRAKVILPYAGARVGVSREWDHPRSWSELWSRSSAIGLHAFVRRDLSIGTAVVDYSEFVPVCIGGCPAPTTTSYAIGGWSLGLAVELAASW
jgi:hypothetical protein